VRILQVITDTDRRGAQLFALDLAVALTELGHSVRTVALAPGVVGGLDVEVIGPRRRSVRGTWALRRRMARFDVTIAHGSSTGPACALAGAGEGRPFVYRQVSDSRFWAPDPIRRARVRRSLARADRVVTLSAFNRRDLVDWIGVPGERIRIIPNGVAATRFPPVDDATRHATRVALGLPEAPTLVSVGAFVAEKGNDLVIAALADLPGVHLLLAGDGPERVKLQQQAARVAPGRVHFVGVLDQAVIAFRAADVAVLASRGGDAMPASMIEAGLCGLPAVSTAVGAIPEIVLDGRTGAIVDPDDRRALTAALRRMTDDLDGAAAMGRAAREHCLANFEITPVARAWSDVLADVVG